MKRISIAILSFFLLCLVIVLPHTSLAEYSTSGELEHGDWTSVQVVEDGISYTMAYCKERDTDDVLRILWVDQQLLFMLSGPADKDLKKLLKKEGSISMGTKILVDDKVVDTVELTLSLLKESRFVAPMDRAISDELLAEILRGKELSLRDEEDDDDLGVYSLEGVGDAIATIKK